MQEVIFLTNINCLNNCIYQKEGKCQYYIISVSGFSINSECPYFKANNIDCYNSQFNKICWSFTKNEKYLKSLDKSRKI